MASADVQPMSEDQGTLGLRPINEALYAPGTPPYVVGTSKLGQKCNGPKSCPNNKRIKRGELRFGSRTSAPSFHSHGDMESCVFWRCFDCITMRLLKGKNVTPETLDSRVDFEVDVSEELQKTAREKILKILETAAAAAEEKQKAKKKPSKRKTKKEMQEEKAELPDGKENAVVDEEHQEPRQEVEEAGSPKVRSPSGRSPVAERILKRKLSGDISPQSNHRKVAVARDQQANVRRRKKESQKKKNKKAEATQDSDQDEPSQQHTRKGSRRKARKTSNAE